MTPLLIPKTGDWRHRFYFLDATGAAEDVSTCTPAVVLVHQASGSQVTLALGSGLVAAGVSNAFDVAVAQTTVATWAAGAWAAEIHLTHLDGYLDVAAGIDLKVVGFGTSADGGVTQIYRQADSTRIVRVASGPPGASGTGGSGGAILRYGAGAPASGLGNNGDFYINTSTSFIYGPKASGTWPAGVSIVGPQGAPGASGSAGMDGKTLRYGAGAPSNGLGVDGDFYINTSTSFIYGPKAAGAWPAGVSIVGPQGAGGAAGAAGADGKTLRYGAGAPGNGLGVDGDFYINTSTSFIYGPKAAGVWPTGVSIVGPAGANGANGANGQGVPLGGTTGQVLAKNTATDYDTGWVTPAGGLQSNFAATRAPTATDDSGAGYADGSMWVWKTTAQAWRCRDATAGSARWVLLDTADHPGYISGNWYEPLGASVAAGGANVTGKIYFIPFVLKTRLSIASLGARVTTLATGGGFDIGIYANNPTTGRPTGTVLAKVTGLSTTTATVVGAAITGGPVTLEPGLYWVAHQVDTTATGVAIIQTMNTSAALMTALIGSATQGNLGASASGNNLSLFVTQTYATGFTDMTSATFTEVTSSSQNGILLQFKAA